MYKIIHTQKSINSLDNFIESYKNSFVRLFSDTGLLGENEIINNYIVLGNNFYDLAFSKIEEIFSFDVLGVVKTGGKQFTTISINNFRLFVYYKEKN